MSDIPYVIAIDMDGTLLNEHRAIPESFWPVLKDLHSHGVVVAPASGRQLFTLLEQFAPAGQPMSVIAENGTVVFHGDEVISTTTVEAERAHAVIDVIDQHPDQDWGLVLCRSDGAFVSRTDPAFLAQCQPYYARMDIIEDLHEHVNDQVVKLAVFTFGSAEDEAAPALREAAEHLDVVVSGANWVDIMSSKASKGTALRNLANALEVPMERTIAFGDYLNDLQLLEAAGVSYAMDNAHPRIKAIADFIAPSNEDEGVVQVLRGIVEKLKQV
ncbi:HAD family hydrolase [Corynebacterium gerontici]|uniref:Phosphatase YwpJ n=1 Tax=Corynebacterium gerontici TaxID=2079234 RepID=A0A3G6IZC2_9CORY|nr:HAD family hydrolase [Corynebacterium gerontici]AZA11052.1 Putative phosphatase YwpJ [Corynebacterium gerontici]